MTRGGKGEGGSVKLMLTVVGVHVVENRRKSSRTLDRAGRSRHAVGINAVVPPGNTGGIASSPRRRFSGY